MQISENGEKYFNYLCMAVHASSDADERCFSLRARVQKCDGKQPTCTPCAALKRECVYEEFEKSRTQKLLVKIQSLEEKLGELQVSQRQASALHRQSNGLFFSDA